MDQPNSLTAVATLLLLRFSRFCAVLRCVAPAVSIRRVASSSCLLPSCVPVLWCRTARPRSKAEGTASGHTLLNGRQRRARGDAATAGQAWAQASRRGGEPRREQTRRAEHSRRASEKPAGSATSGRSATRDSPLSCCMSRRPRSLCTLTHLNRASPPPLLSRRPLIDQLSHGRGVRIRRQR